MKDRTRYAGGAAHTSMSDRSLRLAGSGKIRDRTVPGVAAGGYPRGKVLSTAARATEFGVAADVPGLQGWQLQGRGLH